MHVKKHYITPAQLLRDSFELGWRVFESGYRPDFVVGVWRGGTPVAIAVHELLHLLGVNADHCAVRTTSYTGIGERGETVSVEGLDYLAERVRGTDRVLLVDDVHDTGISLEQIVFDLQRHCGGETPGIRFATPYYKPGNRRTARVPDYFLHETDEWLVFPHELDGLSLPELRDNKPELAGFIDRLEAHLADGDAADGASPD